LILSTSVYVDDKEKYLKPAEELGMKTILFESAEILREQLERYLNGD